MSLLDMVKSTVVPTKQEKMKKDTTPKDNKKKKSTNDGGKSQKEKYKFPFQIYQDAKMQDIDHIFEVDEEYTDEEVTKKMLAHGKYEYAGNVSYEFIKEDNVLIPTFQQHKKG